MRILFTGGGTLGPVTPLLAVAEQLLRDKKSSLDEMVWIGTPHGVESEVVLQHGIEFRTIQSGKLRRYFSWKNFIDPILLCIGIIQSILVIRRFKPDIILGSGGYVQVPVIAAGWLLRKKTAVVQLDIAPGLANLMCASLVDHIFLSFSTQNVFPKNKTTVVGVPIRSAIAGSKKCSNTQKKVLGLDPSLYTVMVVGGGTGSGAINQLVISSLPQLLTQYNIVHITGKGKAPLLPDMGVYHSRYQSFELLTDRYGDYLCAADIIITRGGIGAVSECAFLKKPMIIIPISKSPQEKNAAYFESKGGALWRAEETYTSTSLVDDIIHILKPVRYESMQHSLKDIVMPDAAKNIVNTLVSLI